MTLNVLGCSFFSKNKKKEERKETLIVQLTNDYPVPV
jgi:hypothetical protein